MLNEKETHGVSTVKALTLAARVAKRASAAKDFIFGKKKESLMDG